MYLLCKVHLFVYIRTVCVLSHRGHQRQRSRSDEPGPSSSWTSFLQTLNWRFGHTFLNFTVVIIQWTWQPGLLIYNTLLEFASLRRVREEGFIKSFRNCLTCPKGERRVPELGLESGASKFLACRLWENTKKSVWSRKWSTFMFYNRTKANFEGFFFFILKTWMKMAVFHHVCELILQKAPGAPLVGWRVAVSEESWENAGLQSLSLHSSVSYCQSQDRRVPAFPAHAPPRPCVHWTGSRRKLLFMPMRKLHDFTRRWRESTWTGERKDKTNRRTRSSLEECLVWFYGVLGTGSCCIMGWIAAALFCFFSFCHFTFRINNSLLKCWHAK